jgi:hypothetical protein
MSHPIIQDDQIKHLAPSFFSSRNWSAAVDEDVREQFFRIYSPLRDKGMEAYHLSRIATALYYYRPLLADILKPSHTKCVVEIGSGRGAKAVSWASLFQSYTGIELDPNNVAQTTDLLREYGFTNARVICGNAEAVIDKPEKYGIERIDLLILFAVVEHLTIPERKSVLQLAEKVYQDGGHVLMAESPNRLCRFDQHSWQLPFTDWLPLEIMAEYAPNSKRTDLQYSLNKGSPEKSAESLYRIGRGVSFHEFECFWEKKTYDGLGIANDGYSTELLNYYPFVRDEWDLIRYCADNKVDIDRLFTRYYLEGIFSQAATDLKNDPRYLTPHEIVTPHRRRHFWQRTPTEVPPPPVVERRLFWELDEVTIGPGKGPVVIPTDASPAAQDAVLLIDVERSSGRLAVEETKSGARSTIDVAKLQQARLPIWHSRAAVPLGSSRAGTYRVQPEGSNSTLTCQGALLL